MQNKKKIFIFIDWFDPAFKAGGPIRSVTNLVKSLQDDYDIFVFTADRDLGDASPMPGIIADAWVSYGRMAHVLYASPAKINWKAILHELKTIRPDFIYCNSLFSKYFSIYPLIMKRFGIISGHFVLAPKGMLRESALKFKPAKKRIFLKLFRLFRFPDVIRFHATDVEENESIKKQFSNATVFSILDSPGALPEEVIKIKKQAGQVKLLFVGRIHPIKRLSYLLHLLKWFEEDICLTIVGVVEDKAYWFKCQELINNLPVSVKVNYAGELAHKELAAVIDQHHVFVLPTMGENFGHAIYESLGAGRPVLISDQTPWKNLAANKAGWEFPLTEDAQFSKALREAIGWDQQIFDAWSDGARKYVKNYFKKDELLAAYKQLFN